ncbi:MAG: hypothetical protein GTO18_11405 [Anaerolineales bacterium]|nr:hypothetical protein [Anaerolineales bacterium]
METSYTTREDDLNRVLNSLSEELPDPYWIALVDQAGLVTACIPSDPIIPPESISAMAAVLGTSAERVLTEIEGGRLRYASLAGSERQYLMVMLGEDRLLSIGLRPEVQPQTTFRPLRKWIPELINVLKRRYTTF